DKTPQQPIGATLINPSRRFVVVSAPVGGVVDHRKEREDDIGRQKKVPDLQPEALRASAVMSIVDKEEPTEREHGGKDRRNDLERGRFDHAAGDYAQAD